MAYNKFILASSSPQRLSLLKQVNVVPDVVVSPNINEDVLPNEGAFSYAKRIAHEKALVATKDYPQCFILSADTSVIRGSRILGKPLDENQEMEFLTLLSGKRHKVITAYCIYKPDGNYLLKVVSSIVYVKSLSTEEKKWYISTNQWKDKAGGYSIGGAFEMFIKQINGCVSNIIGLPLPYVYNSLKGCGYDFLNEKS